MDGTLRTRAVVAVLLGALMVLALAGCGTYGADQTLEEPIIDENVRLGGEGAVAPEMTDTEMSAEDAAAPPLPGTGEDASTVPDEDRLIIRDKALRVEVEDVRDAVDEIRSLAKASDAIVTSVNVASDEGPVYRYDEYGQSVGSGEGLSGWITVRIPAEQFEDFVDAAIELGDVQWESESTEDVTQQHVDLSARLENLQAEEARLRGFFDRAQTVEELLLVEAQLARVRGDIEAMQAQIAYLERQAAMATVTIELSEPKPVVRPDGPDWGFTGAITEGLQLAADLINAIIVLGLGGAPVLVPILVVILIIVLVRRGMKRRRAAAEE